MADRRIDDGPMCTYDAIVDSSFGGVPEELIEYILMHLTPHGDLQACALVCRLFYRLANGAKHRLRQLFERCTNFDWYLLQLPHTDATPGPSGSKKYGLTANVAERCSHSAVYHPRQKSMYVFGGCTANYTMFNDLLRFDLASRAWTRPMPGGTYPTPKSCASLVRHGDALILYGGWTKSSPNPIHQTAMFFNEMHVYDATTNMWSLVHDESAPHLAGHAATMLESTMIVFGGSYGNGSSNTVWLFDTIVNKWRRAPIVGDGPSPRYGHTQMLFDSQHIVVVGGCGGPNMIYTDVWLLDLQQWRWTELHVVNAAEQPAAIWSHNGCRVGDNMVLLGRPPPAARRRSSQSISPCMQRRSSPNELTADRAATCRSTQSSGSLTPPRRKLITSRSLDEHEPSASPASLERKNVELHRARSIPAIIVGEIPTLVVTKDDNQTVDDQPCTAAAPIAMLESSLLPNQATLASPSTRRVTNVVSEHAAYPSVRPNAQADRGRQLEILRRAEEYIRQKSRQQRRSDTAAVSGTASGSPPPPAASQRRHSSTSSVDGASMCVYVMDLSRALDDHTVSWRCVESPPDAPSDTILYTLVRCGGDELVLFGGMRTRNEPSAQLHANPQHSITNETYMLRAVIEF